MNGEDQFSYLQSISATLAHCYDWLISSTFDLVIENPNFNSELHVSDIVTLWCIHGTADRNHAFAMLVNYILNGLAENVKSIHLVSFDYRFHGKSIRDFAEQVRDKIRHHSSEEGIRNVVLMGHSRGGLVAAYFTEYLAREISINVKAVFALGAPFGGSAWALWLLTKFSDSVEEMQIGSAFLRALNTRIKVSDIPYFYFAAAKDGLVTLDSSTVEGQEARRIIIADSAHVSMMRSESLFSQFLIRLNQLSCMLHASSLASTSSAVQPVMLNEDGTQDESFQIVDVTVPTLQDAIQRLNEYTGKLKAKYHLWSAQNKIQILEILLAKLTHIQEGERGLEYSEADTVGAYIRAFLNDAFDGKEQKNQDILNAPLNPLTSFFGVNASTRLFMEKIINDFLTCPIAKPLLCLDMGERRESIKLD